jgi:hypothetical protein
MSGHLRLCFAAVVLLAGFSTSPASSNPFDFLFKTAPEEAAAPAPAAPAAAASPAEEECLQRPGKSTTDGRWVYRLDGGRKCWFQAAKETAPAKKVVHRHAAKQRVAAPEEEEAAPRKPKAVVDARAELVRSTPAETPQPTPPAPEFKVVDADAVPATAATALVPPAPVVAKLATDQPTPNDPTPPQVDVDTLLAAAPAASDAVVVSVPPTTPAAVAVAEEGEGPGWIATWLGALLMGLGLVSLLVSSWTLRGTFAFRSE